MKHTIQVEEYTRDSDGHSFARVVMRDLAGSDSFSIVCMADSAQDALLQLAHRLRLVSRDALDIAGRIFEKHWVPDLYANSSSQKGERPNLRLVNLDEEVE